jgi:hypothetical protein
MKYEKISEFVTTARSSRSSVYRFYNKNEELWSETKKKGNKRLIPVEHLKYFDSEIMFDENKVLRSENQSMKNLIDCLVDKDSLQYRLWQLGWDFFFTIAYRAERNKKSCFRQITGLYESLIKKYGDESGLRIFFTTEPFVNRIGFHNHFVIRVENEKLKEEVVNEINKYFSYDRVDVTKYDKYKAGLFYISKEGLVNEDWDILGNNLRGDNIKYDN